MSRPPLRRRHLASPASPTRHDLHGQAGGGQAGGPAAPGSSSDSADGSPRVRVRAVRRAATPAGPPWPSGGGRGAAWPINSRPGPVTLPELEHDPPRRGGGEEALGPARDPRPSPLAPAAAPTSGAPHGVTWRGGGVRRGKPGQGPWEQRNTSGGGLAGEKEEGSREGLGGAGKPQAAIKQDTPPPLSRRALTFAALGRSGHRRRSPWPLQDRAGVDTAACATPPPAQKWGRRRSPSSQGHGRLAAAPSARATLGWTPRWGPLPKAHPAELQSAPPGQGMKGGGETKTTGQRGSGPPRESRGTLSLPQPPSRALCCREEEKSRGALWESSPSLAAALGGGRRGRLSGSPQQRLRTVQGGLLGKD